VVWTPPGHPFLAIEPMTAQTNAFNLTQAGVNADLQIIPPRSAWRESFWITPSI
jgi:galactose mutarotase-like enzyme